MTYKNLIDMLAFRSSDAGAAFKANAYLWLNVVRAAAATRGGFATAKKVDAVIVTAANQRIYALEGGRNVWGDEIINQTNNSIITRDTSGEIASLDPDLEDTGPPELWADAGQSPNGDLQVLFWPMPDAVYALLYNTELKLADVTEADADLSRDAYFGNIIDVAPMLMAGLYWQFAIFDGEDDITVSRARSNFHDACDGTAGKSGAAPRGTSRLEPVLRQGGRPGMGRFNSHYDNR